MVNIPDKVLLQLARSKATTDANGVATLVLDIPSARYISGGMGWFETHHADDHCQLYILAPDDSVAVSFQDEEITDPNNKGWYMTRNAALQSVADIRAIVDGLDVDPNIGLAKLKIVATKGDALSGVDLRVNILWGKRI